MKRSIVSLIALAAVSSFLLASAKDGDAAIEMSYRDTNPLREALKPVPKDAVFKMDGFYLWDPSVIKVGDGYHLFASRWPEAGGMQGWFSSQVIRATSKSLYGPYTFAEVVLDPSKHPWATRGVHNPKITRAGSRFLIYHLGIPVWKTGFAFADRIEGPWQPVDKPVIPVNTPAVLIKPDGSVYAVGKFKVKGAKEGELNCYMQAFAADNIMGPYTVVGDAGNRLPHGFELEDPTIWWANGRYNVICTDWKAKVTGIQKAVVYYTSRDGIHYTLFSNVPVWSQNDPIPVEGGEPLHVSKVERPQVCVDENGAVEALLAAVHPPKTGPTYLVIRPAGKFIPSNRD